MSRDFLACACRATGSELPPALVGDTFTAPELAAGNAGEATLADVGDAGDADDPDDPDGVGNAPVADPPVAGSERFALLAIAGPFTAPPIAAFGVPFPVAVFRRKIRIADAHQRT